MAGAGISTVTTFFIVTDGNIIAIVSIPIVLIAVVMGDLSTDVIVL